MFASEIVGQINILAIIGRQKFNGVNSTKVIILQHNPIINLPILIVSPSGDLQIITIANKDQVNDGCTRDIYKVSATTIASRVACRYTIIDNILILPHYMNVPIISKTTKQIIKSGTSI